MQTKNDLLHKGWLAAFVLAFFFFLSAGNLAAQDYLKIIEHSEGRDFEEVVNEIEKLYANKDKGRGTGYKQFQRWKEFNSSRLTKDGKIQNVSKMLLHESEEYQEYLKSAQGRRASRLAANTASWTSLGATSHIDLPRGYNPGMGRVNVAVADPANVNIIYAGSPSGGLWRTLNGGTTWTCLTENIPSVIGVSGIAVDPSSPIGNRTIYFLSGDGDGMTTAYSGVYKSTDNGTSWSATGTNLSVYRGRKLIMHPTNYQTLYLVSHDGIYRTTTGGSAWTTLRTGVYLDLEFKPGTPATMYASTYNEVFITTDEGNSWNPMPGLPALMGTRTILAVTPANPNYIYVLYGSTSDGMFGGLYRSTNGSNFSLMSNSPNILGGDDNGEGSGNQSDYDLALEVSPTNELEVHVGGINCWKSVNGGSTWARTSKWGADFAGAGNYTHADIHNLAFFGTTLLCASDGGVYKSTNNAEDWTDLSAGLQISEIYRIGCDPNSDDKTVCGLQDNGLNFISNQTLYAWHGGDGMEAFASPVNSSVIFGSTQFGGLLKSTDNGLSVRGIKPPGTSDGNWVTPFLADPSKPATIYAGYTDIYRSDNEGTKWVNISNGQIGGSNCVEISVAPSNSDYIYVSKGNTLYRTTNGGALWTNISNSGVTGQIKDLEVHGTNPDIVFFSTSTGVVKLTMGGSASWTTITTSGLPSVSYNTIAHDKTSSDNSLYLGTDLGVYYKNDNLSTWLPFSQGLPKAIVRDIEIHYTSRTVRAGTYGRGAWKSPLYDISDIQVAITSPGLDSNFFEGNSLQITANASTSSGTISKVEFYNGTTKLGEDLTAPYAYTINSLAEGHYKITAKAFNSTGSSLVSNQVGFTVWKLRNPENPAGAVAGIDYNYYEGVWDTLPDFSALTPVETGVETTFSLAERNRNDEFGFQFKGYVQVPADGIYSFYTTSDDGSELLIGDVLVADNDGLHGEQTEGGRIALKAGKHAITVSFFEQGGGEVLTVAYEGPGIPKQLIPASALFRTAGNAVSVSITSPSDNASYTGPATIPITASTVDPQSRVSKVEFYRTSGASTLKIGEDASAPYTYTWSSVPNGDYYIFARALEGSDILASSSSVHVTVSSNTAPVVSITSPANNASFTAPASITINASASDADGSVSKVEFYNGTQLLGTDNVSPYSYSWSNVGAGTYTLTAVAYDNLNLPTTSSPVTVNVSSSSSCAHEESTPSASLYVLRNEWFDQSAGSSVTNESGALKVIHRAWGKSDIWVVETGTTFSVVNGQTYTFKFDFKDHSGYMINAVDVGFAQGLNSSNNGPNLVQPVVTAPAGYSSASYTTKMVNITSAVTGNVSIVFRLRWASQPSVQVSNFIKDISVCANSAFPVIADVRGSYSGSKLLILPNPTEFQFILKAEKYITRLKVTNQMGQEVYAAEEVTDGTELSFGKDFANGIYNMYVQYVDGSEERLKILKGQ